MVRRCPALLALAIPAIAAAQLPTGRIIGRIIGRVVDAAQGAPVAGAQVEVVDASIRTVSALDGRYALADVPVGPVSVRVRMIGYAPKVVTGIAVQAGQTVAQDVAMAAEAVQLAEISVSAQAERGTVNRALDEQRHAPNIRNTITAEQIARSPDSDAGQAVQRVSGVTVQDGKYVLVRGLGERYTTTSLNGARVPSPEPERKVVPLDLFPSGLLQSVTTSKTLTPDQPGDFSGAQVDIRTREFPAHRQFLYSLTLGLNDAASRASVPAPPSSGGEWIALTGRARDLPSSIASAGNFSTPLAQPSVNQMVSAFRDAWSAQPRTVLPNTSSGVSVGGEDPVFGRRIGYLASLTYSYNQEVRADEIRAYARPGSAPGSTEESDHYDGATGRSSVLWGGLVNLSTLVGSHSKFALNTVYNRSADNEARLEVGSSENLGGRFRVSRLQYVERAVRSIQLSGEHQLGLRHRVEWALTSSGVRRKEPDRSEIVYALDGGSGTARWFSGSNEGAVRTFGDLDETGFEAGLNYRLLLGESERAPILKVGGLAGFAPAQDAELNAFTLAAIGSGTKLSYLEADAGLDDSYEFFGGAVDAQYLVSYESGDDHFDMSEGFSGRLQYLIAFQSRILQPRAGAGNVSNDPEGIENDGCAGANCTNGQDSEPFTIPLVANFTLIGTGPGVVDATNGGIGMMLRRGTGGYYLNGVVSRWPRAAISLRDATTDARATAGDLQVNNLLMTDITTVFQPTEGSNTQFTLDLAANSLEQSAATTASLFTALPATPSTAADFDWTPAGGSAAASGGLTTFSGAVATKAGTFVVGTGYRGAADPAGAKWRQGWTAYQAN